jgi:hypothetical protein
MAQVSDTIDVDEVEIPGIKLDKFGHSWAIPRSDDEAFDSVDANALNIPDREPGFYYYFEKTDNVSASIAAGFRTVSRKEAGFTTVENLPTQYGTYDDENSPHRVGDLVLMKGLQESYDRIDKARQKTARTAVGGILRGEKTPIAAVHGEGNVVTETVSKAEFTVQRKE